MTKITVASRGVELEVDTEKLSQEILDNVLAYGLQQKLADAASGAAKAVTDSGTDKDDDSYDEALTTTTLAMMQKAYDALLDGTWSSRAAGSGGISELLRTQRQVIRQIVKAKFGAKSPQWAKFTGLADADQLAKLDAWFADNADALAPRVEQVIAERKAAKEAKAALGGGIKFDL